MLLCYLRDFVTIRYNKILDLSNKYEGSLEMDKKIDMPKRNISLQVRLHEEKRDDNYLREHNAAKTAIDRIDLILKTVLVFLATPLMEITSKSPMLKPPITKTNVLKMDNNFKGAVALYDYILAYDKPGYRIDTKVIEISPFHAVLAEEMSESVSLMSFLTYAHALDLYPMLKQNFNAEEARRKDAERKLLLQHLEEKRRRLAAKEESLEDFVVEQDMYIQRLEEENRQIDTLHLQLQQLGSNYRQSLATCDAAKLETESVRQVLSDIEQRHQAQLDDMKEAYDERIHQLLLQQETDMKALEADCQARIHQLNEEMQAAAAAFQEQLAALNDQIADRDSRIYALEQEKQKLAEEILVCEARIKAIRTTHGETLEDEDFTQKEHFDRLEKEYKAFARFYRANWSKTKKSIRSQLLNFQYLKGKSKQ
jgi:peptidoglycan hydrolase CwlO-like protein